MTGGSPWSAGNHKVIHPSDDDTAARNQAAAPCVSPRLTICHIIRGGEVEAGPGANQLGMGWLALARCSPRII